MGMPISQAYGPGFVQGGQTPIVVDYLPLTQMLIGGFIVDGTAQYSVEASADNIMDLNGKLNPNARWFTLDAFPQWTSVTKYVTVLDPWQFIRININALTGHLEFKVNQSFVN